MKVYMNWEDVRTISDVSRSEAYRIIHDLNQELEEKGYRTVRAKIPTKFFCERYNVNLADVEQILKEVKA